MQVFSFVFGVGGFGWMVYTGDERRLYIRVDHIWEYGVGIWTLEVGGIITDFHYTIVTHKNPNFVKPIFNCLKNKKIRLDHVHSPFSSKAAIKTS